ncbi:MAG: FMN-binding glutamate synthase family protein, partial [Candidatus Oxydemutatoraceae bacterium WSBS_2016_MAG_OTU14]
MIDYDSEFVQWVRFVLAEFSLFFGAGLILLLLVGSLFLIYTYIRDKMQKEHAIRRNYPLVGHFRALFEHLGEFFRQYFFAMDREELPFNRAQRVWIYRAAKNLDTTTAFGSTKDLRPVGSVFFVNCPFPSLEHASSNNFTPVTIGASCKNPYVAKSIINISAMSYGAISKPAVLALSNGARMAGCWMNTGEGGVSPYHLEGGADIVFQIGTAKNGVRTLDGHLDEKKLAEVSKHKNICMIELKMSQGAKPGKGGILPKIKVTEEISKIRGIPMGEDALSPNRHIEIDNNDDLLDMINRIRDIAQKPVGFKVAIGAYAWIESLLKRIHERGIDCAPDFITVDSADGGTGAAPMALIDSVGLPIQESLPIVVDQLIRYKLRDRIKVIASGKLINPSEVAWALCVGADFVASARGFMFSIGCIQALQCNKNTCPTGITTHKKHLQQGLDPASKAVRVFNFVRSMHKEVDALAHSCGVHKAQDLQRFHARMRTIDGKSASLEEVYPTPEPLSDSVLNQRTKH